MTDISAATSEIATLLSTRPRISAKLVDENDYPAWSVEAQRQLWGNDLIEVVTGSEKEQPTDEDKIKSWKKCSYKALDYLMDSCEIGLQLKIRAATTAAQAWDILKNTYEGQTRVHLILLHANIMHLKYDDRRDGSLAEHITKFEGHWLKLVQAAQAGHSIKNSLAEGIYPLTTSDAWKGALLLSTLPRIQPYINIVDNITSKDDKPSYSGIVMRLQEINPRSIKKEEKIEPLAAFYTQIRFCAYYKVKGWPGTSHNEINCRTKKRDQNRQQAHTVEQPQSAPPPQPPVQNGEWAHLAFMITQGPNPDKPSQEWWADSYCLTHITNSRWDLTSMEPWVEEINTGGGPMFSTHKGTVRTHGMQLSDVLLIPNFPKKLISIGRIDDDGGSMMIGGNQNKLEYQGVSVPLTKIGRIYRLESAEANLTEMDWHSRYGHLPFPAFSKVPEAPKSLCLSRIQCEECILAKSTKPISPAGDGIRTTKVGELIHSDIYGPMPVESFQKKQYIITFVDDFSRFAITAGIRQKSDVPEAIRNFTALFE